MADKNLYLEPILILIKEKQNLARIEFKSTDLNGPGKYSEMEKWFSELESAIVQTPPDYYVENIILFEDACGKVIRIEYEYCDEDFKNHIPSIRIVADLK